MMTKNVKKVGTFAGTRGEVVVDICSTFPSRKRGSDEPLAMFLLTPYIRKSTREREQW